MAKKDLPALSTVKTFNDLAKRAKSKASESLQLLWKAGETATEAKASLPHGEWTAFVEKHYDVDLRSVERWMKFHATVDESKIDTVSNLTAGLKMLDPPKNDTKPPKTPPKPPPEPVDEPEDVPFDTEPEDYGKCPNCAGEKWIEDDDGAFCEKCHHPHGEPAGDVDEDRIKTQRQKTVKTVEALMRAFDDLQLLCGKLVAHDTAIERCKLLLETAKEWK